MRRRPAVIVATLAGLLACATLVACESVPASDNHTRRFTQPSGLKPERVLLGNEPLEDRDRNGYVETFRIVVYVFGDELKYPLPMTVDGTFQFRLIGEGGKALGVWAFAPREVAKAVFATQPGPAYGFEIALTGQGTDRLPAQAAGLTCEIITNDGLRVGSREPLELRIGGRDPG